MLALSRKILQATKTRVWMKLVEEGAPLLDPINPTAAVLLSAEQGQKGSSKASRWDGGMSTSVMVGMGAYNETLGTTMV